ncbi:MAG: O-antigen ligase family protein [Devosia sp.]|uniref:O-antigen ligase family protein n=1 Tax=Devosia sp. TaxID=1871048 RepID=UPI0024C588CC|nr:O-antigen ligase family protein [Devosia sp.]UYN99528.1 MAG: O-antigen ligase family protein [Devosia sp.]
MATAPYYVSYVVLVAGVIGLLYALAKRDRALVDPATILIILGLLLQGLSLVFVYRQDIDALPLLSCLPLLVAPSLAALLTRPASRFWLGPHAVPALFLFGAVTAAGAGLVDLMVFEPRRVGVGNNPIHYAGLTTILGFMALMGMVSNTSRWRVIYLLGPAAAIVAVVLSGSRGPLLACAALVVVALPFLLIALRSRVAILATLAAVVGGGVAFMILADSSLLIDRILGNLEDMTVARGGAPVENAVRTLMSAILAQDEARAAMYEAGWHALQSSPIFGVGYTSVMPLARELFPDLRILTRLENLHSDLANFAAVSGGLGLAAFGCLLLAPLAALRGIKWRRNPALVLGVITLVVAFATLGLTNAMFGVLPQTVLFATILAYLMALSDAARFSDPARSKPPQ